VGIQQQDGRLVPGRQLHGDVAVVGNAQHGQVVLGVQHHA
jgi:hypothetical protein